MIYYPNKYERYSASLRLLYQRFIINNGIKLNYLNALKKLYEFEALFCAEAMPINIEKLLVEIFTAVLIKKKFDYFMRINNSYFLEKKKLISLILNIASLTDYLEVAEIGNRLVVKGNFIINEKIILFTKSLEGMILKEAKTETIYLVFNFPVTKKETEDFETAYHLLQNPLSVINLYLID